MRDAPAVQSNFRTCFVDGGRGLGQVAHRRPVGRRQEWRPARPAQTSFDGISQLFAVSRVLVDEDRPMR
jgi:hypothetical protein